MKKLLVLYLSFGFVFIFMIMYHGCSELKDGLVTAPALSVHSAGWLSPSATNFHGKFIAVSNWSFQQCITCHGSDFMGGNSGASCFKCHTSGPQDCNGVCHGSANAPYPPKALSGDTLVSYLGVGTHNAMLTMDSTIRYAARVECNECHRLVTSFSDSNHIIDNPDGIAEVVFGTLAKTPTGTIVPNPIWVRNTATCSGTYCHGNFKNGNVNAAPVFNNPNSVVCGSCHGDPNTGNPLPGGTHPTGFNINQCYFCHPSVINSNGQIINKTLHVNGFINRF